MSAASGYAIVNIPQPVRHSMYAVVSTCVCDFSKTLGAREMIWIGKIIRFRWYCCLICQVLDDINCNLMKAKMMKIMNNQLFSTGILVRWIVLLICSGMMEEPKEEEEKRFRCNLCWSSFTTRSHLIAHNNKLHIIHTIVFSYMRKI